MNSCERNQVGRLMRSFIGLLTVAIALLLATDARAQGGAPDDLEPATAEAARTPTMVVHEPAVLPQAPKPAGADAKKGAPTKAGVKAAATGVAQPQSGPQQPLIIPASSGVHSEMASTGNPKYDQLIAEAAARNLVDPNLIVAVMRQESGFNQRARSYKGATGLMQLMPATASRFGVTNIYDPQQNIEAGARYLRFLLDTFDGDVSLALAGYNAGENAVVNSGFR